MPLAYDLSQWKILCALADTGSLSAAAELLGMDVGQASKALFNLEKHSKKNLVHHSKCPVRLTPTGVQAVQLVKPMISQFEKFLNPSLANSVTGRVCVAISQNLLSSQDFVDCVKSFCESYKNIELETIPAELDSRNTPIPDIIIELGKTHDQQSIQAKKVPCGTAISIPVASLDFIKRHGMPSAPEKLENCNLIFCGRNSRYLESGDSQYVVTRSGVAIEDANIAKQITLFGQGIGLGIPLFQSIRELEQQQLYPVAPGWQSSAEQVNLIYPVSKTEKQAVRTFVSWQSLKLAFFFSNIEKRFSAIPKPLIG